MFSYYTCIGKQRSLIQTHDKQISLLVVDTWQVMHGPSASTYYEQHL